MPDRIPGRRRPLGPEPRPARAGPLRAARSPHSGPPGCPGADGPPSRPATAGMNTAPAPAGAATAVQRPYHPDLLTAGGRRLVQQTGQVRPVDVLRALCTALLPAELEKVLHPPASTVSATVAATRSSGPSTDTHPEKNAAPRRCATPGPTERRPIRGQWNGTFDTTRGDALTSRTPSTHILRDRHLSPLSSGPGPLEYSVCPSSWTDITEATGGSPQP